MKKLIVCSFLAVVFTAFSVYAQLPSDHELFPGSCTSIMVGKKATTDGSVITAHACDGNYRTWLNVVPAADFPEDTVHHVYWGRLHTETVWDTRNLEKKGEIPQVRHTYAYLNTAYPCLNEKQVAIGETTIYGRRELRNEKGLFLIENLQEIALQRCSTARQAVETMGRLAEKYGYGDYAECLTVADPQEVWHFEISGAGEKEIGALWAAVRIPDDHVGVSANISRIPEIDFDDPDNYMYSRDLKKKAKKLGYWDGEEPFKFYQVISGRKPFSIREYYVLSTLAPSLELDYEADELPFSVKPEHKVSVRDVMKYYRNTYEGTRWDMTRNLLVEKISKDEEGNEVRDTVLSPVANPWMSRDLITLLNTLKPETVERHRAIAMSWCSYTHVTQCRDWLPDAVGAVAWFAFDNPAQSPRIPIFSGTLCLPGPFDICGQHRYRTDAALWSYRVANRLSTVRWQEAREMIEQGVAEYEEKAFFELPLLEEKVVQLVEEGKEDEARELVTRYTRDFAYATMKRWEVMSHDLWHRFGMGF
ncbi:MAG TPA: peptidase [Bacteroidetes bacterium]|nr:peptidase [Bacteroidota bacterium]